MQEDAFARHGHNVLSVVSTINKTPTMKMGNDKSISDQFGMKLRKRGRPAKNEDEKYESISVRLHPKVLAWAKEEAQKRGINYQTVINEALLEQIS